MCNKSEPILISADWGTSSFRAFLLDRKGDILERRETPEGIMKVANGDFGATFSILMGQWLNRYPDIPVLLSGMIGSEQGWALAPHLSLPTRLTDLSSALHPVPLAAEKRVFIVPGLTTIGAHGVPDIIRGEETQIFGVLDNEHAGTSVFCLPGTHSKWVTIADGAITGFQTALTGEALSVLSDHSILGRLMEGSNNQNEAAFFQGLNRAMEEGGLLHHLFGVRSQGVNRFIPRWALRSYLTGILIGHEIQGMRSIYPRLNTITIIAGQGISEGYEVALQFFGFETTRIDGETAAIRGHVQIARSAGLIV